MTKQLTFPMSPLSLVQLGLILWLSCTSLFAQVKQAGLVRLLNSKNQVLPGVSVIFDDAPPQVSGSDGRFILDFRTKKEGELLFLESITKSRHELVNEKSFQFIKASKNGQLAADIIMAPIGTVEAAKKEYYAVSSRAVKAIYDQQLKALQTQVQKAQYTQEQYAQKLAELQLRFEEQKKQLDHLADRFARVNFDDVSELYREALELFKKGKIEEAIKKLESANLLERVQKHLKEQVNIEAEDTFLTVKNREITQALDRDLEVLHLQTQLYMSQQQQIPPRPLPDSNNLDLFEQVRQYMLLRDTNAVILTYQKIIRQPKASLEQKITAYSEVGNLHQIQKQIPQALRAYLEHYKLSEQWTVQSAKSVPSLRQVLIACARLGSLYLRMNEPTLAASYFSKGTQVNNLLLQKLPNDPMLKFNLVVALIESARMLRQQNPNEAKTRAGKAEKILLELNKLSPQNELYRTYLQMAREVLNN